MLVVTASLDRTTRFFHEHTAERPGRRSQPTDAEKIGAVTNTTIAHKLACQC